MPIKSGHYWVAWANAHAKNSSRIDDLAPAFRFNVNAFVKALTDARATVEISATKRNANRAYLFHWSWMISQGRCKPSEAEKKPGVEIEWDHHDEKKSKAAALEMARGFGLAVPPRSVNVPALASNHIAGKAIDMTIRWSGKINLRKKDGIEVTVSYMENANSNVLLHDVGASYGVIKLKTDAPHWSFNGR